MAPPDVTDSFPTVGRSDCPSSVGANHNGSFRPIADISGSCSPAAGEQAYATGFNRPWAGWLRPPTPAFTTCSPQAAWLLHWLCRYFRGHRSDGIFTDVLPADGSWHPFEATRRPHPRSILLCLDGITGCAGGARCDQTAEDSSQSRIGRWLDGPADAAARHDSCDARYCSRLLRG